MAQELEGVNMQDIEDLDELRTSGSVLIQHSYWDETSAAGGSLVQED